MPLFSNKAHSDCNILESTMSFFSKGIGVCLFGASYQFLITKLSVGSGKLWRRTQTKSRHCLIYLPRVKKSDIWLAGLADKLLDSQNAITIVHLYFLTVLHLSLNAKWKKACVSSDFFDSWLLPFHTGFIVSIYYQKSSKVIRIVKLPCQNNVSFSKMPLLSLPIKFFKSF